MPAVAGLLRLRRAAGGHGAAVKVNEAAGVAGREVADVGGAPHRLPRMQQRPRYSRSVRHVVVRCIQLDTAAGQRLLG